LKEQLSSVAYKAEEMKLEYVTIIEKFSAMQYETKQSLFDKITQLNEKLGFFEDELAKLWTFEDNRQLDVEAANKINKSEK